MGVYLNPGSGLFLESLNSRIYVDKTHMIRITNEYLNTENKYLCISRPRRFGKSVTLKMLAAYYSKGCDSREIFESRKIGDCSTAGESALFEKGLNRYDTLLIDIQGILGSVTNEPDTRLALQEFLRKLPGMNEFERRIADHPLLTAMQRRIIRDIRETANYSDYIPENEEFLGNALQAVYQSTGNQFVLLIDEWDCIFRNYETDLLLQDKYIDLLRNLFKNLELQPVYALVYMTGILPIKRYGTQSALNNFREYTMLEMAPFEEFTGFTESETEALYLQNGMDMEQAREWYDGYQLDTFGHIFNPNSVVESLTRRKYKNFWTATGTYESVKKPIEMNFDGLKEKIITMIGNGRCRVDTGMFNNTMTQLKSADDVLTLLIHLGYLGYDSAKSEVYIPNKEIRDEFVRAIRGVKWSRTFDAISRSEELLEATLSYDAKAVASQIEKVHEDNTSILTYNNENALSCVIQLAYYQAQDDYMLVREMPAGKGFADIAFIPRKGITRPAMIIELKWNQSAQTAIDQIRNKNYSSRFEHYFGDVLLVGISYSQKNGDKKHECRIEKINKVP